MTIQAIAAAEKAAEQAFADVESAAASAEKAAQGLMPAAAGFIARSLNGVPRWATAIIGTLSGAGLMLAVVLNFSGLRPQVQHAMDAWALSLARSSDKMELIVTKLDRVIERLDAIQARADTVEARVAKHDDRLQAVEVKVDAIVAEVRKTPAVVRIRKPAPAATAGSFWPLN